MTDDISKQMRGKNNTILPSAYVYMQNKIDKDGFTINGAAALLSISPCSAYKSFKKRRDDEPESVDDFLARGGKMEVLPSGVSSDPILLTGRDKYNRPISSRFINTKHKPPKGYQISKETNERHVLPVKLKSGKTRYKVIINGSPHGRFDSIPEAVEARNKVWAKLGITEADFL